MSARDDALLFEFLETARQRFAEGDKTALLAAMHQCLLLNKPVPEWLRLAFVEAYQEATGFNIRSWDEVFGKPVESGAHLKARREYAGLRYAVAMGVAMRAPSQKIEKGLFESIGAELGISGTKASEIYYDHGGKDLHDMLEPLVPWLKAQNRTSGKF
jgi:hypothetical protein